MYVVMRHYSLLKSTHRRYGVLRARAPHPHTAHYSPSRPPVHLPHATNPSHPTRSLSLRGARHEETRRGASTAVRVREFMAVCSPLRCFWWAMLTRDCSR